MKKGLNTKKAKVIKGHSKTGNKVTKIIHESTKEIKIERALTENLISLQKVLVTLATKVDNLTNPNNL